MAGGASGGRAMTDDGRRCGAQCSAQALAVSGRWQGECDRPAQAVVPRWKSVMDGRRVEPRWRETTAEVPARVSRNQPDRGDRWCSPRAERGSRRQRDAIDRTRLRSSRGGGGSLLSGQYSNCDTWLPSSSTTLRRGPTARHRLNRDHSDHDISFGHEAVPQDPAPATGVGRTARLNVAAVVRPTIRLPSTAS